MVRVAFLLLAVITVASSAAAAAAALGGISSPTVGSGSAAVARCDADGVTVAYTTSGGNVTSVTIGDLADPGCEGGTITVTLVDAANTAVASAGPTVVPADVDTAPNSVTRDVSPTPDAAAVAAFHVSITGP